MAFNGCRTAGGGLRLHLIIGLLPSLDHSIDDRLHAACVGEGRDDKQLQSRDAFAVIVPLIGFGKPDSHTLSHNHFVTMKQSSKTPAGIGSLLVRVQRKIGNQIALFVHHYVRPTYSLLRSRDQLSSPAHSTPIIILVSLNVLL